MKKYDLMLKKLSLAVLLLLSGLLVYWLYRTDISLFQYLNLTKLSPVEVNGWLDLFLKNYFSDLVWCIALVIIASILMDLRTPAIYPLALLSIPVVSELLQATKLLDGVFDWVDVLIYISVIFFFLIKRESSMKTMKKHLIGLVSVTVFTFSIMACFFPDYEPPPPIKYTDGVFTIPQKADEIFTKKELKTLIKSNKKLSMVLRVPLSGDKVTQEERQKNSVLYNIIEKEFAKAGFVVRDRALFAKVLDQETLDYSKIGMITETDFILELLSYTTNQPYLIKQYVDETGALKTSTRDITFKGAMVEFKLISVKKNDMVGSYTFYYTPCTEGCSHRFSESTRAKRTWSVKQEIPKNFFEESAKKLISELVGGR